MGTYEFKSAVNGLVKLYDKESQTYIHLQKSAIMYLSKRKNQQATNYYCDIYLTSGDKISITENSFKPMLEMLELVEGV